MLRGGSAADVSGRVFYAQKHILQIEKALAQILIAKALVLVAELLVGQIQGAVKRVILAQVFFQPFAQHGVVEQQQIHIEDGGVAFGQNIDALLGDLAYAVPGHPHGPLHKLEFALGTPGFFHLQGAQRFHWGYKYGSSPGQAGDHGSSREDIHGQRPALDRL